MCERTSLSIMQTFRNERLFLYPQELVKSQSFTATKIRKSTDIELTKLKAELERVKKLKKSIYEDYKDELISKEEFLSYREDYQQKETLYSKQIETLEEKKKESVTEDVFETPQ